jgi:hypothetical protein
LKTPFPANGGGQGDQPQQDEELFNGLFMIFTSMTKTKKQKLRRQMKKKELLKSIISFQFRNSSLLDLAIWLQE